MAFVRTTFNVECSSTEHGRSLRLAESRTGAPVSPGAPVPRDLASPPEHRFGGARNPSFLGTGRVFGCQDQQASGELIESGHRICVPAGFNRKRQPANRVQINQHGSSGYGVKTQPAGIGLQVSGPMLPLSDRAPNPFLAGSPISDDRQASPGHLGHLGPPGATRAVASLAR